MSDPRSRGQTVEMIDPRTIKVKPDLNARDMNSAQTREDIEVICASIMSPTGFLRSHPIEIFKEAGEVFVSAGHKRLAASLLAISKGRELHAIPCLAEARGTKPEERFLNQDISNNGTQLTLGERGVVYKNAMSCGLTEEQIAERVGRSVTYVRNALDFLAAPAEVHKLVSEGKVSVSLAAKTVREEGPAKATAHLTEAVARAESAGKTKARPKDMEAKKTPPAPTPDKPNFGKMAFDLVKSISRLKDPMKADDFDEEVRRLANIIDQAKTIARGL